MVVCAVAMWAVSAAAIGAADALIVLDPGHSPQSPGATSARGRAEYLFNEAAAAKLEKALAAAGLEVKRTRADGADLELSKRAQVANAARAALLVSVHHDAVGEKDKVDGVQSVASGYSLHVRGDRAASVAAAQAISRALADAGFAPCDWHQREFKLVKGVDPKLAVYDRRELAV